GESRDATERLDSLGQPTCHSVTQGLEQRLAIAGRRDLDLHLVVQLLVNLLRCPVESPELLGLEVFPLRQQRAAPVCVLLLRALYEAQAITQRPQLLNLAPQPDELLA